MLGAEPRTAAAEAHQISDPMMSGQPPDRTDQGGYHMSMTNQRHHILNLVSDTSVQLP